MATIPRAFLICLALLAAVAAGVLGYLRFLAPGTLPSGLIQASGRIEGLEYTVAPKYAGRIRRLAVREGDRVLAGEVLARLDSDREQARVRQAGQRVRTLTAREQALKAELKLLREQVPLDIELAEAELKRSRAALAEARAKAEQAVRDARRFRRLEQAGSVSRHERETAEVEATAAREGVDRAESQREAARRRLEKARLGRRRIEAKEDELRVVQGRLEQARAALREAESVLQDMAVRAPVNGTVVSRTSDPGEVVSSGTPLATLVNLDRLYLKAYVPEDQVGRLHLGQEAQVFADAYPERSFPARVSFIASRAEFTPKEVQTKAQRTKLVYAVKLTLERNPDHVLTPGLPADAVIRTKESAPWHRPIH